MPRAKVSKRRATRVSKKKKVGRLGSALRYGGQLVGSLVGGAPGGTIGRDLGASLSRWLGAGEYQIQSNTLMAGDVPSMHQTNEGVIIRHKEYLGDIFSSSTAKAFTIRAFPLNPGLSTSFPWLSSTANNFTEYTIKGLIYHFKSNSGDAFTSADASTGSVMMCTQYRSSQAAPANKQEVLQQYWSQSAAPQQDFVHAVECDPKENPLSVHYVRSGTQPANEDLMFYDLGTTYIASVGLQGTSVNMGELWVTYEIELKKPQLRDLRSPASEYYHAFGDATGVSNTAWFAGFNNTESPLSTFTVSFPTANSFTLPRGLCGRYLVKYMLVGSGGASIALPTINLGPNCGIPNTFFDNTTSVSINTGGSTGKFFHSYAIDIIDPNVETTITYTSGTGVQPTSLTSIDFFVIQIPFLGKSYN